MNNENTIRFENVAKRIKDLRIKAGFTSYEHFALEHGFDRKQYWRLETNQNLRLDTLFKICDIHKITLEEFFKGLE